MRSVKHMTFAMIALAAEHRGPPWRRMGGRLTFLGVLGAGAYLLVTEHPAHLARAISYLPWLLLLGCPLMHVFMLGGHGRHDDHRTWRS